MFPHNYYNNKQNRRNKKNPVPSLSKKEKQNLERIHHNTQDKLYAKIKPTNRCDHIVDHIIFVFLKKRYPTTSAPPQVLPLLHKT